jgi:dTDP-4-dehydrorhamnose 3,5-epimerase
MKFQETKITGTFLIDLEPRGDDRGSLSRIWDYRKFLAQGLKLDLVEGYITASRNKGTMRGVHYQVPPKAESKLTRCLRGAVYELVVDLRPESPTYKQFEGYEFYGTANQMLLIPERCGHAILTLEDNTDFMSFATTEYSPEYERGIRHDDKTFNFSWPIPVTTVSPKDSAWRDFEG